jgi:formylglycine-generating enzyme required for sulfatase activity
MRNLILAFTLMFTVVSAAHGSEHESVTRNADWTPVEQDVDGFAMVLVPPGCFMMGSTPEEVEDAYAAFVEQFGEDASAREIIEAEAPQHLQCFDEPFWIDQYPVTQADFIRLEGARSTADRFSGANRPVETVNWYEASDFCELRGGRLPTEAEWEYTARGPDSLTYPWGDEWDEDRLVWNRPEREGTAEVGSIPEGVSWVGAYDLSGSVWEWTSTIYDPARYPYPYDAEDGRNLITDNENIRVLRGGAWASVTITGFRAAYRVGSRPQSRYYSLGFRCVLSD